MKALGGDGDDFGFARRALGGGGEFGFGAEPIGVGITWGAIAFEKDVIGAEGDFLVRWR